MRPDEKSCHQSRNPVDLSRSFPTVARLTRTSAGVQTDVPSMSRPSLWDSGFQVVEENIKLAMLAAESDVGTSVDQSISVAVQIDSPSDACQMSAESKRRNPAVLMTFTADLRGYPRLDLGLLVLDRALRRLVGRVLGADGCSH